MIVICSVDENRRNYRQFCGCARALDHVGERWTLLIVRNLLLGPRRYSDLLAELPGITTNLLAKRLKELEQDGIVVRKETTPPNRTQVYDLGAAGQALEPVIMELGRWGARFLGAPEPDDTVNIAWGLLSLKRRYAGGLTGEVGFKIDDRDFELRFSPERYDIKERSAARPDVTVAGDLASFQAWLFRGASANVLRKAGKLRVDGDAALWESLTHAFEPGRQPT